MEAGAAGARPVGAPRGILRVWGDDRLVARVRGGDDRAFEAIYDRHHRGLLSFCRHMLGNREEAEDALQHTFAAAYRALLRSDSAIQLKAWLYAIARNHCLSVLRARREAAQLEDDAARTEGLAEEVERRDELRDLVGDLQRLPHDQRAALVLTELGAHSHEEIGVILGVRRDKVKALVFQARESLIASRHARETSCRDIREQLSVLRGGALRRTSLRRHVEACDACRAFRAEVARQRAAMALVLPVAPSMALKGAVLGPVLGAGAGAACAATGVTVGLTTAASSVGPGLSLAGKGIAAKALVAAAVAGVGGGAVAVEEIHRRAAPVPHKAPAHHSARVARAVAPGGTGALAPATVAPTGAVRLTPLPWALPAPGSQGGGGPEIGAVEPTGAAPLVAVPFVVSTPPAPAGLPFSESPGILGTVMGEELGGGGGDGGDGAAHQSGDRPGRRRDPGFDDGPGPGGRHDGAGQTGKQGGGQAQGQDGKHAGQPGKQGGGQAQGQDGKHAGEPGKQGGGQAQGPNGKHAGQPGKHADQGNAQGAGQAQGPNGKQAGQGNAQGGGQAQGPNGKHAGQGNPGEPGTTPPAKHQGNVEAAQQPGGQGATKAQQGRGQAKGQQAQERAPAGKKNGKQDPPAQQQQQAQDPAASPVNQPGSPSPAQAPQNGQSGQKGQKNKQARMTQVSPAPPPTVPPPPPPPTDEQSPAPSAKPSKGQGQKKSERAGKHARDTDE